MKKLLVLILSVVGIATAKAYDYPYLTFQNVDGMEKSVSVELLTITYADGKLVAMENGVAQEFDVAQLSKMYFSTESASIEMLDKVSDEVVEIYNLFGFCLGRYNSAQHALSSLEKGIYVMKSASETHKIVVQ